MQVIARRTLKEFWERHPQAQGPIRAWFALAGKARWRDPNDIKRQLGTTVDFVGDNRVIFDLGGNKYRLIVHVSYTFGRALVKFIGTHAEYDRVDPETVSWRRKRSAPCVQRPTMRRRSTRSRRSSTASRSPERSRQTASTCSPSSSRITRRSIGRSTRRTR